MLEEEVSGWLDVCSGLPGMDGSNMDITHMCFHCEFGLRSGMAQSFGQSRADQCTQLFQRLCIPSSQCSGMFIVQPIEASLRGPPGVSATGLSPFVKMGTLHQKSWHSCCILFLLPWVAENCQCSASKAKVDNHHH